jgi:hypothetical protein
VGNGFGVHGWNQPWGGTSGEDWMQPDQPQMATTARDVPPHSHQFHAASIGPAAGGQS